jgi:hypothetical protein
MIRTMQQRRHLKTRSFASILLVALLLTITGFTLMHWHKNWPAEGCQLCHVRHLPSLHTAIAVADASLISCRQDSSCEHFAAELDTCMLSASGRAPPSFIFCTL